MASNEWLGLGNSNSYGTALQYEEEITTGGMVDQHLLNSNTIWQQNRGGWEPERPPPSHSEGLIHVSDDSK
ncbi:uncharacterized protein PG998_007661 [Apiospora kogelbergensis]|uniref:Uncharacterized protein n=1 Tax=Apiospora kogelbergensis TaxID=1337665 RepID=A0AAW0QML5_9PEZI